MRDAKLHGLFSDIASLKGVGPKLLERLAKLGITRIIDMLRHMPVGLVDRRYSPSLSLAEAGRVVTLKLTIIKHETSAPKYGKSRRPYRIIASDGTDVIELVYFNARADYLTKSLPVNSQKVVSGVVMRGMSGWQMRHPDVVAPVEQFASVARLEPVYPLSYGLSSRSLGKLAIQALTKIPTLPEWIDAQHLSNQQWPSWGNALKAVHHPQGEGLLQSSARARLAYDEMLAHQITLQRYRKPAIKPTVLAPQLTPSGKLTSQLQLPFTLTRAQQQAIAEVSADIQTPTQMMRLLQGDVGSGKTMVALYAMLQAVEAGYQAVLMAPTDILARQHHATLVRLLEPLGLEVALLTGREKGTKRKQVMAGLEQGEIMLCIGTHALFQDAVSFARLGLVVIDEQHRFGVKQRHSLATKGAEGRPAHCLLMTATPIPRTLAMTLYGDMASSRLDEKPANRKPIITRAVPLSRLDEVMEALARAMREGRQAYWICPLVEPSEESDIAAAEDRHASIIKQFGSASAVLVHGKMTSAKRDSAMEAFAAGTVPILVATTVVEVGVDVPNASIIIIEHAERFGLAQLHQLRGRVGRGEVASSCLLLYSDRLSEIAAERLLTLRNSEDGFYIAEQDLRLRGGGEILGIRQSGLPQFYFARLPEDTILLEMAHEQAKYAVANPTEATALLCQLFEYDTEELLTV